VCPESGSGMFKLMFLVRLCYLFLQFFLNNNKCIFVNSYLETLAFKEMYVLCKSMLYFVFVKLG